jgi:tetratricopeptide (TPR) repeat protein
MLPESEHAKALVTLQKSFQTLNRLIELQPENPQYQHQLARALDQLSNLHYRSGDLDAWEASLRQANQATEGVLENFEPDARNIAYVTISRNRLAHCLDVRGKPGESLELFQAALEQRQQFVDENSGNERMTRQLASSHANVAWNLAYWQPPEQRDLDEALRHAKLANELDFEAAEHWTCRAYIRYLQSEYEDVNQVLGQCEAVNPPDQMARFALRAMTYWQLGKPEEARAALAEAKKMRDSEELQSDADGRLTSPEHYRLVDDADELIEQ